MTVGYLLKTANNEKTFCQHCLLKLEATEIDDDIYSFLQNQGKKKVIFKISLLLSHKISLMLLMYI